MKHIVLGCNLGMSTSLLVSKMEEAAKKRNIECEIHAYPVREIQEKGKEADIILLGPQVRFELDRVKKWFPTKPVLAIDMVDYGMVNGEATLEKALAALEG